MVDRNAFAEDKIIKEGEYSSCEQRARSLLENGRYFVSCFGAGVSDGPPTGALRYGHAVYHRRRRQRSRTAHVELVLHGTRGGKQPGRSRGAGRFRFRSRHGEQNTIKIYTYTYICNLCRV